MSMLAAIRRRKWLLIMLLAALLRRLNKAAWAPNANGELLPPGLVVFDTLGWQPNPSLLAKLAFKPPIIDQMAKEAGFDPAALDLRSNRRINGLTAKALLSGSDYGRGFDSALHHPLGPRHPRAYLSINLTLLVRIAVA